MSTDSRAKLTQGDGTVESTAADADYQRVERSLAAGLGDRPDRGLTDRLSFVAPYMAYQFGEFALDEVGRSLTLRGQGLSVQPKVFDLLAYLVRHAGRVVSKQELMEHLWAEVHVSEASLQRAVSVLRRTLREGSFEHALKSFTGHGYRFSLDQPDLSALLPASEFRSARTRGRGPCGRGCARLVERRGATWGVRGP